MKNILIDTNCYSAFLSGDQKVLDALASAGVVFVSVFVLGELFFGFRGGSREKSNIQMLHHFLNKPTVHVLNATAETAEVFGALKSRLKKQGTPIPLNDIWIAAHAVESGSVLVTYDTHFLNLGDLRIWHGLSDGGANLST